MKHVATVAVVSLLLAGSISGQAPKRALTIEDYYRIKTIGDAQLSPNGQWVAYSLSTRIEDDNTTSTETDVVNADGSGTARRITHAGNNVAGPRWTDDNLLSYTLAARVPSAIFIGGPPTDARAPRVNGARWKVAVDTPNATPVESPAAPAGVTSADGKWIAQAKDGARSTPAAPAATEFEQRHADRFKGRTFDWMRFQIVTRNRKPAGISSLPARMHGSPRTPHDHAWLAWQCSHLAGWLCYSMIRADSERQ